MYYLCNPASARRSYLNMRNMFIKFVINCCFGKYSNVILSIQNALSSGLFILI